ncbi:GIY-YIG nuclease family protein [Chlorobaculum limnaeum]|uniref:GIY-YIG nuclease family protein n=1 Tax=Chlorobaculum limnaeum TaxID=274537 RepID=UPI000A036110|nr:GIY-YIG nuclease family protein [Chlorobaculum limnaeum]
MENAEPHYLYILKSGTADRYYVGISSNPRRRLDYHNSFEKGFTSRYRPWRIVFTKESPSKAEAHAAETTAQGWKSREGLIGGEKRLS